MDVSAQLLSVAAAALVLVSWGLYLKTIPDNKVPRMPIGSIATQVIAMGMAHGYGDLGSGRRGHCTYLLCPRVVRC